VLDEVKDMAVENDNKKVPQRVVLEIFGDSFALKTDDPEHMETLGKLVDQQMKKVAKNVHSFDSTKIAILTALQLADDYCQLKKDYDELVELINEK
jgi:cell division protein ZapA